MSIALRVSNIFAEVAPFPAIMVNTPTSNMVTGPLGALNIPSVAPNIPETKESTAAPMIPASAPLDASSPITEKRTTPKPID